MDSVARAALSIFLDLMGATPVRILDPPAWREPKGGLFRHIFESPPGVRLEIVSWAKQVAFERIDVRSIS